MMSYDAIRIQFNNIVPKEENICFDAYVSCDENLAISEPLDIICNQQDDLAV